MVAAVVAACAVLVGCGLILVRLQRSRRASDRRLEGILGQLDRHLEAMSASVARAVDAVEAGAAQRSLPPLTLDFDELLGALAVEAAARTGADAVVLRVEGPGGRPAIASFGSGVETESLDRSFGPPGGTRFEGAAIDWTYSPADNPEDVRFRSALVTPLGSTAGIPGVVAAYAFADSAFRPEHAAAVRELFRDAAVALANARRFTEVEARVNVDPATGIGNRRAYDLELGREVARAERTGRPLSVVVLDVREPVGEAGATRVGAIADVARLVTRMTRRGDIACRRGERDLAVLLPGTEESGASVLTKRLREAARQILVPASSTVTVGLVERLPTETREDFDLRIDGALGRPRGATVSALDDVRNASTAGASTVRSTLATGAEVVQVYATDVLRRDAVDALARELSDAVSFGRALAVVVLEVHGIDRASERLGREAADTLLGQVARTLDRSLGTGSVHRLASSVFALVLPGSVADDAEALVDALQTSLGPSHDATGLVLSAGITELGADDEADSGLARAEHALWQAKHAGQGTIVVAVPNRRPTPPS